MTGLFLWLLAVAAIGAGSFLVGYGMAKGRAPAGGAGVAIFGAGVVLNGLLAVTHTW